MTNLCIVGGSHKVKNIKIVFKLFFNNFQFPTSSFLPLSLAMFFASAMAAIRHSFVHLLIDCLFAFKIEMTELTPLQFLHLSCPPPHIVQTIALFDQTTFRQTFCCLKHIYYNYCYCAGNLRLNQS